jgi:hypothetical protein
VESSETKAPVLPEEVAAATDEEIAFWRGDEPLPETVLTIGEGTGQIVALLARIESDASTIATLRKALLDVHDALHRECSGDVDLPAEIRALRSRITADAERIERLRGYAAHETTCPLWVFTTSGKASECTCGLSDLLGEVE